jgi:hypothetical protein
MITFETKPTTFEAKIDQNRPTKIDPFSQSGQQALKT